MSKRGRPPLGPNLVEGLEGSDRAKERFRVVLETISGECTIPEACEKLGIGEAAFHKMRTKFMEDALAAIDSKMPGRPRKHDLQEHERIAELERENKYLKRELQKSEIREEIALIIPEATIKWQELKKKEEKKRKRQLRKERKKAKRRSKKE